MGQGQRNKGFIAIALGVTGVLISAYIVFLMLHMARTLTSRSTLLPLAVTLGVAVLCGMLGLVRVGGRK